MNGILLKQYSAITRSNTAVAPLSSNSSSYLFHPTPLINHLSLPTNSNSSASSGIYGKDHPNGKSSKHHGGYCSYSDYKSNVIRCAQFSDYPFGEHQETHFLFLCGYNNGLHILHNTIIIICKWQEMCIV
jgi:hypothetical protein